MKQAYYNEIDPKAAAWLRELIARGHIAPGVVDERSIADVRPSDLAGYVQCHFFAGIGGWSHALRLAGWPDDRPVWTGSCPCQPFSCAGRGRGAEDPRHLWPQFRRLISESRPPVCFGEQVASAAGRTWLAGVRADLEDLGYCVGAADLCSAGAGAPHIRQRLYWVADAQHDERWTINGPGADGRYRPHAGRQEAHGIAGTCGQVCGVADAGHKSMRRTAASGETQGWRTYDADSGRSVAVRLAHNPSRGQRIDGGAQGDAGHADPRGQAGRMEHSGSGGGAAGISGPLARQEGIAEIIDNAGRGERFDGRRQTADGRRLVRLVYAQQQGLEGHTRHEHDGRESRWVVEDAERPVAATGPACFWGTAELIPCTDGTARRVEPGVFPLADGVPARVGRLRGYGNAITPQVAEAFVRAWMECKA